MIINFLLIILEQVELTRGISMRVSAINQTYFEFNPGIF